MKKHLLIVFAVIAFAALFTACPNPDSPSTANQPNVSAVYFIDKNGNKLDYTLGDTDLDPEKVAMAEIKFDKAMDTTKTLYSFLWANEGDITSGLFVNDYCFRAYLNLRYDVNYRFILNPMEFQTQSSNFFRDKKGTFLEEFIISFSTKTSPVTHPHTFEFSLDNTNPAQFVENEYDAEGKCTNVAYIDIRPLLKHDTLCEGDKLTLNYSLWSYDEINNLCVHLADRNGYYKYWKLLINEEDIDGNEIKYVVADKIEKTEAKENIEDVEPVYYNGSITFDITSDLLAGPVAIQLYYDRVEGKDPAILYFKSTEN